MQYPTDVGTIGGRLIPDSVNTIFGLNLRILCKEAGTFSDAARHLDISRIQLARFMRGESFPKPNQLDRICRYFNVDARIFTEPLARLREGAKPVVAPAARPLVPETLRPYAERDIPLVDGVHMVYRPSFTFPDLFIIAPLLVRRHERGVWLKGVDVPTFGARRRDSGPIRDRSYAGFSLSTPDGFVIYFHGTGRVPFLSVAQFGSTGYFSATGYFRGTYDIHRPAQPGERRRVPIILSPMRQKAGPILAAARSSGIRPAAALPETIRMTLQQAMADL